MLLSQKLKFAIKVSLSLTLAFMIPMAFGWAQPNTAAITVMLIATAGSVSESFELGLLRTIGTIIGAMIGLTLIAIFPQDRLIYLSILSILIPFILYLYNVYQGDSTAFMLTAMMIMMVFGGGNVEDAFLYGVDRTFMTLFGILVYTFVGVFLWPMKKEEKEIDEKLDTSKVEKYIWLDKEYLKGFIQSFFIFSISTYLWIEFNPPGGFMVVLLATLLSTLTSFSPLKPSLLGILFSIGFIFAILMYVFVLPNLVYAWQLAIFLFAYTFIAFYVINQKISIFFLLGLFVIGISNTMTYNFDIFLNILLMFYLFISILFIFYYFPFSTKPEDMFIMLKDRVKRQTINLISLNKKEKLSYFEKQKQNYYSLHLQRSLKKIKLWSSLIDLKYFINNTKEDFTLFVELQQNVVLKVLALQNSDNILKVKLLNEIETMQEQELSILDMDDLKRNKF